MRKATLKSSVGMVSHATKTEDATKTRAVETKPKSRRSIVAQLATGARLSGDDGAATGGQVVSVSLNEAKGSKSDSGQIESVAVEYKMLH